MASLEFNIKERIGTITFNRPDALNALNLETLEALAKITRELPNRTDISVVILTGAGEKAFVRA